MQWPAQSCNSTIILRMRTGFGQEYEQAAVYENDCRFGGVRNTFISNYVYCFSAREIRKTFL
jgi:hypothetical protein